MLPEPDIAAGTNTLSNVPALTWCFGCSATSAAMMFGHYDNSGYPNMYAGPTNGGVFPMTNESWGTVVIGGETRALCPLSATRMGLDGRTTRGHVDDYWIAILNAGPDPFIGNWPEHTHGDCTGDYMGTNQSNFSNVDGSTTFVFYTDGSPLYDFTEWEPEKRDGGHGMRLFAESRGYEVVANYNQYIYGLDGNTQGFTFEDFKNEIDAGRPVMIQVAGHSMLGFGYNDTGATIYVRDTWDYAGHQMTWGGTYSGMQHYGVTVIEVSNEVGEYLMNLSFSDVKTDGTLKSEVAGFELTAQPGGKFVGHFSDSESISYDLVGDFSNETFFWETEISGIGNHKAKVRYSRAALTVVKSFTALKGRSRLF